MSSVIKGDDVSISMPSYNAKGESIAYKCPLEGSGVKVPGFSGVAGRFAKGTPEVHAKVPRAQSSGFTCMWRCVFACRRSADLFTLGMVKIPQCDDAIVAYGRGTRREACCSHAVVSCTVVCYAGEEEPLQFDACGVLLLLLHACMDLDCEISSRAVSDNLDLPRHTVAAVDPRMDTPSGSRKAGGSDPISPFCLTIDVSFREHFGPKKRRPPRQGRRVTERAE